MNAQREPYATSSDFCRIFQSDMDGLYLLALLLTADPKLAERCFVEGLQDARHGNRVFREWAQAWSRRMIIKNAIRALQPVPESPAVPPGSAQIELCPEVPQMGALFSLPVFERFVFVVTVLEGYSDRECALLFGCTRQVVVSARVRALQVTGDPGATREQLEKLVAEKTMRSKAAYGLTPAVLAMPA